MPFRAGGDQVSSADHRRHDVTLVPGEGAVRQLDPILVFGTAFLRVIPPQRQRTAPARRNQHLVGSSVPIRRPADVIERRDFRNSGYALRGLLRRLLAADVLQRSASVDIPRPDAAVMRPRDQAPRAQVQHCRRNGQRIVIPAACVRVPDIKRQRLLHAATCLLPDFHSALLVNRDELLKLG